jgi:hypothetical protein
MAQVKAAVCPSELAEARSHVLLACLTNPITDHQFTDPTSMLRHCESVFTQLKSFITEGRSVVPGDMEQVNFSFCVNIILFVIDHLIVSHVILQFSTCYRFTLCPPCTVSAHSGIREITVRSPPPSPVPSASQSATPLYSLVTPIQCSRGMGFTLLRMTVSGMCRWNLSFVPFQNSIVFAVTLLVFTPNFDFPLAMFATSSRRCTSSANPIQNPISTLV